MTAESNRLEYKEKLTDDLEKEVVAFLNAGGGQIHFGVRDDSSVAGVDDADALQLQIKDRIVNNIRPGTLGLFDLFVEMRDEKSIVILNLAGGPAVPYYIRKFGRSEKGCFLRIGSAVQPMSEEHIEQLHNRRQPAVLTAVVSRHQDLSFQQLKIFYEGKSIVLNQHFAKTLDLLTPDGKFNQLAYLFADTNRISIRVAKWWGADKIRLHENEEYGDCSLVKAMQKVLDKFDIENVTQARKRGMKTREEKRYVDAAALREILINAFAHNDYSNGDTPIFEIFQDRFEITSYGGLVTGMTQEEFFTGVSRPRNPEIMRIFKDLEYVERLGSGIPYVVAKYGRGIFKFSSSIIRFVLPFDNTVTATEMPKNVKASV
ncbi:MAG: putative DNA binding domain-containing protein, partial [Puniceicoccales bacterium]|nr:putative DNA binding domain-containing protein [Puniceicoccales bacterium]